MTLTALAFLLLFAAPAFAQKNGAGLSGFETGTSDQDITFISLGVICFFPLFIYVASVAQSKLEKRKQLKHEQALRQRTGW